MNFIKTTLIGGLVFLIPISVCVLILGKVHKVMVRLTEPLAAWLQMDSLAGLALTRILAVVIIVVLCFAAGLFSRSGVASRLVEKLESGLLHSVPGYTFIKGLTGGLAGDSEEHRLTPVLARFDDVWQVAFAIEQLADGRFVLFLPGAPEPWSGTLAIMTEDRVEPLDSSMSAIVRSLRALGRGSRELLSR